MSDQYDHYEKANEIILLLESEGLFSQAETIRSSIKSGSTGTEILMALRWNLSKLIKDRQCSVIVLEKSKFLLKMLNEL